MVAPNLGQDWALILRNIKRGTDELLPTTEAAIDTLKHFSVVPCNDGGIQIEVHRDGFDIEIVIGPDGCIKSGWVAAEGLAK